MGTDVKLSSEFTIIYGGEVIAYCTDFTLEKNKEVIDITKLGDTWKNKKVDTKDFSVSFNGMITRGDTITALLWDVATAYSSGDYVVLAGKAWEAQGSTTGDNPTTDNGTNWLETSEWLVGTTYAADDLVYITSVSQETRIYKSLQGSNTGNDPLTEAAYWERLETNYESLLNELKHNDTVVMCTIKPSSDSETYYYGEGVLSALSASFGVGDKATFSGTFDGSGSLATIAYGPELHTAANAASIPNETDATTGFTPTGLTGTGANVFDSRSDGDGGYMLHTDANDTPTNGCMIAVTISGVEVGETYLIVPEWKHIGTGGRWSMYVDNIYQNVIIDNTETVFDTVQHEYVAINTTLYITFLEYGGDDNGGIDLKTLSAKKEL